MVREAKMGPVSLYNSTDDGTKQLVGMQGMRYPRIGANGNRHNNLLICLLLIRAIRVIRGQMLRDREA